jgi:peptidoglycan/xylan/chitin deacetylase (PgdA/CDA1 family)
MPNFRTTVTSGLAEDPRTVLASRFYRGLIQVLSPSGPRSRLSILIYHRVLPEIDPLFPTEIDAKNFDAQMGQLAKCFRIIPLLDAVKSLRQGSLPARAACITFDDGYADNAEIALPILQKHGLPATFFVATGFLDGGRMWNDTVIELIRRAPGQSLDLSAMGLGRFAIGSIPQRQQTIYALLGKLKYLSMEARQLQVDEMRSRIPVMLPENLMMTSHQVRQLHTSGMDIGGHTVNHPILARMEKAVAQTEIASGKEVLENIIRAPVKIFAYPNGKPGQDYHADHVEIIKNLGFEGALSTAWGAAKNGSDLYQLPRFTPWDNGNLRFMLRMVQNMMKVAETI